MNAKALRGNGAPVNGAREYNNGTMQPRCLVRADGAVLPYTAHCAVKAGFDASADLPETHLAGISRAKAREAAVQAALLAQQRKLEAQDEAAQARVERDAAAVVPRVRSRAERK